MKLTSTEIAVKSVIESRWKLGRKRYGIGINYNQKNDIGEWLDEAIEECADQLQYLVAAKELFLKER